MFRSIQLQPLFVCNYRFDTTNSLERNLVRLSWLTTTRKLQKPLDSRGKITWSRLVPLVFFQIVKLLFTTLHRWRKIIKVPVFTQARRNRVFNSILFVWIWARLFLNTLQGTSWSLKRRTRSLISKFSPSHCLVNSKVTLTYPLSFTVWRKTRQIMDGTQQGKRIITCAYASKWRSGYWT